MAKDNLFLGFGRGKIGDVVFYRRNGQQISRARNRSPRNPNTFRQQLQRAVSANVQRLYSAGMEVFNHSFEGRTVGEGNQQEFVSQNMKLLRNLLVSDYNLGRADSECSGRIGAPGLTIPVPFDGMCISNGSIQQQLFSWDQTDGFSMPEPLRDQTEAIAETVGAYARRVGLVPNDIYTFVAFGCDPVEGAELAYYGDLETFNNYAAVFSQLFGYAQLRVLPDVLDDQTAITSSTTLASFFTPAERGTDISGFNLVSPVTTQSIDERMVDGMIGCIRSREDSGVRSPSFMHVQRGLYDYGLTVNYLAAAWSRSAGIAGSDLLLEGSDFAPSEVDPNALTITPSLPISQGPDEKTIMVYKSTPWTLQQGRSLQITTPDGVLVWDNDNAYYRLPDVEFSLLMLYSVQDNYCVLGLAESTAEVNTTITSIRLPG
mgnify:CR=1 FL=1